VLSLKYAKPTMVALFMCATFVLINSQADAAEDASVAWLRKANGGGASMAATSTVELRQLTQSVNKPINPGARLVPLGSLWKLYVYGYLIDSQKPELNYTCNAASEDNREDDKYCCEVGESIDRNTALARSCAPYFSPTRLGITSQQWRDIWQKSHAQHSPPEWLLDTKNLRPDLQVSLQDLLQSLAHFSPTARQNARVALLDIALFGYGKDAWTELGTGIRYKTFSWHRDDRSAFGGAAGWLEDGTPFWFGANGSSRSALRNWASRIHANLPSPVWQGAEDNTIDASCVDVDFFQRYPIERVLKQHGGEFNSGKMQGQFRVEFKNGNWLNITSQGRLELLRNSDQDLRIIGRFGINDYVARVVDREGSAQNPQAARALAIAARSYLLQNAHFEGGCWRIADTSQRQRVSPNPASAKALAAAWFTDALILLGAQVRFHQDQSAPNQMSWVDAVDQAKQSWSFERILQQSFPSASIATVSGRTECQPLTEASRWLATMIPRWNRSLQSQPGFELLEHPPRICALQDGNPYSDQKRMRIYARGWSSLDERITLAHEYLHLVFRFHPNSANETYIEQLARQITTR
jgi:uncharacterized protein YfaQ (DUF2300 family)